MQFNIGKMENLMYIIIVRKTNKKNMDMFQIFIKFYIRKIEFYKNTLLKC